MSLRKTVCSWLLAFAVACALAIPCAARAAGADSTRARGGVRVMSDRALIDLNARPGLSPAAARTADSLGLPSPTGATLLTVGGAIAPVLFLAGSVYGSNSDASAVAATAFSILGPGLGYYYGQIGWRALPGQLLRASAFGLLALVYIESWDSDEVGAAFIPVSIGAGAIYVGATIYDIASVGPAVERANQARLAAARPDLGAAILRDGTPALAVRVRF